MRDGAEPERDGAHAVERELDELREALQLHARRADVRLAAVRPERRTFPGQGFHNVVLVATEHDSVYAFDADGRSSTPIWKDSFINPAAGVTPIPPAVTGETGDIPNEIGITGTPVIDPSTNTIYVVAATKEVNGGTTSYVNRLHALDLTTGAEKLGGPVVIQATVPGNGVDSVNGTISFNNITENQRPALLLAERRGVRRLREPRRSTRPTTAG